MTHLESNPNAPKPSCDDSIMDEEDLPISNKGLYVPSGDVVKAHCNAKNNQFLYFELSANWFATYIMKYNQKICITITEL